jgi:hypothetical protein
MKPPEGLKRRNTAFNECVKCLTDYKNDRSDEDFFFSNINDSNININLTDPNSEKKGNRKRAKSQEIADREKSKKEVGGEKLVEEKEDKMKCNANKYRDLAHEIDRKGSKYNTRRKVRTYKVNRNIILLLLFYL